MAWGIVAIAFYVPSAIGQALLAEGGKDGAQLRSQVRLAVLLAVGLMAAGTVATFLGKGVITAAYGHAYHDAAQDPAGHDAGRHPVGDHLAAISPRSG